MGFYLAFVHLTLEYEYFFTFMHFIFLICIQLVIYASMDSGIFILFLGYNLIAHYFIARHCGACAHLPCPCLFFPLGHFLTFRYF